ncbi:hypothetical protein JF544_14570 [Halobacillus kuroshimensis]|uniref:Uncharacterized protein n=1 Tax=Halobacillus kuroshimensis TaxID=302481 RepID=A0ABS3DYP4_9BACI|nr:MULTISPECIES: hypothetical protein [Halobacillus]MBN8236488.1 hypothetical protein [Halobacillus kuroshimensis]
MIYAYLSPLFLIVCIFVSTLFVVDWLSKMLIYGFLVNLIFLPWLLLYRYEDKDTQEGKRNAGEETNSQ